MNDHRVRRGGFTLIELLVVIAIITVLIAIALPVYAGWREKVRQKSCMANLQQLAISVRMYALDYGSFPGPYDPATGQGGLNALYPTHLDNRAALICPDDPIVTNQDYIDQTIAVKIDGEDVLLYYSQLIANAVSMYGPLWHDPGFFAEHYSSYNNPYNWMGYAYFPEEDDETPFATRFDLAGPHFQELSWGDSLAFWYKWHLWDPDNLLGLWSDPGSFQYTASYLQYHLGQQVYWYDYDPSDETAQQHRLTDNMGRTLWDYGNPDQFAWDYMPYGMPSSAFPGLINRNAPDNTIITRCVHHRPYTTIRYGNAQCGQDVVLRLDGTCTLIPGLVYDWAVQPRQLR